MRSLAVLAATCVLLPAVLAQEQAAKKRLEFADLRRPISWTSAVPAAQFAADSVHVEWTEGKKRVWFDPASGAVVEPRPPAGEPPAASTAVRWRARIHDGDLYAEKVVGAAPGGRGAGRSAGAAGPGGNASPGPDALQLTKDGGKPLPRTQAHISANGRSASFVAGNNLFAVDVGSRLLWQITTDGGPELLHGILDWVYQEELYGRGDFQGHWWSPDGRAVAFLSLDESQVREFTVVDHVPEGFLDRERSVVAEVTNYPKAGDPNPRAMLSVAHVADRRIARVDLSAFPADALVVRVEWTPDGATLLMTIQDRIQTWAELCAVDPDSGKVTRWIREESPTWVNRPDSPRWLADGSFLWLSERTGYQHVYHYRPGGELVNAVTSGEWQVRAIERVDEARGLLWFEGTRDGATGRHYYRIGLDGKGLLHLTPGVGTHQIELRGDGAFLIDRWSAMDRPLTVRVLDGETGRVVKEIGQASTGAAVEYEFAPRQRLSIRARDGYELDASLMLPTNQPAGARFPIFLPTYSGPDAPSVRDSWSHSTWHQFLCQQGFAVLQVNVRSASGRGMAHTGTCYLQLGVPELRDLEDAVDFVCSAHGGDPERVAIQGWSYGGFMAAYALTHSKRFALGLAGAGVYDWRLYDTIYTERYMRTPQENEKGYDATSVIKKAKDLHGHLVLVHGSMDDNVHLQNAMQLLWELQRHNVQSFELMIYPRSRHGLASEVNQHHQELQWRALQRLLR